MSRRELLGSSGELSAEDDCLLDVHFPPYKLEAVIRREFHPVPTVCVSIILLLLQVAFVALTVVSGYFCILYGDVDTCRQYTQPFDLSTVVIISKVVLWLLHVLNERFYNHHHSKARGRGYHKLYQSTRLLESLPLLINSTGNAAVLLIISAQDFLKEDHLSLYLIWSVLILELILTVISLVIYTVRMYKFNRSQLDADVIEEHKRNSYQTHVKPGIGFRTRSSLEEVVAKQGTHIEYLKRHSAGLGRHLLAALEQRNNQEP
ncbi:transmembrane protein 192 [Pyxicephalus adspersus]|uniref:transmembrane protein 192 n=1 Tax=Pyxicephalus adspersus TaxID=30357 RepID=UPI003B5A3F56